MAILDFLKSTNYPQSFLEGTFGPYQGSFYTNVVNPAKLGTGPKPSLGTLMKNWSPLKAFTPQMLATGPTKAASTFLKSSGIGTLAGLLFSPTHLGADDIPTGNMEQEYFDYYSKYGDNYSDLKIPGWNKKGMIQNKKNQLMNQKKQQMQQTIRQAEAAEAAKQKAAADAAAAKQVRQNIQTYGNRDRPNEGINAPGGGKGQSPTGGDVAGTPFVRGGYVDKALGGRSRYL